MIPKLLVPIDGSEPSAAAVRCAAGVAEAGRARVILLWAGDVPGAAEHLARAAETLRGRGITTEVISFPLDPVAAITRTARLRGVDLVVMARHGAGPRVPGALGPLAEAVVRRCPVPVLLTADVVPGWEAGFRQEGARVAALFDGTTVCEGVLPAVAKLQQWLPFSLRLVGLPDVGDGAAMIQLVGRLQALGETFGSSSTQSWAVPSLDPGAAVRALREERAADLFVLPVHGDWPAETGSLTPLAAGVLDAVDCPTLLVRVECLFPLGSIAGCLHV